ncbi:MAG: tRNA glutamyl-Q(34) synthetase GluQRS [Alphaproteobacteria bacterium]|nr:tRNA glutamyl-Q(34) synthetase GluQRS [Alphaproteobacteria bacterium]
MTAAKSGDRFLLRIEDIDRARCRPEYEAAILEDLAWLGLRWEKPVLRQSKRAQVYREALERLAPFTYRCFCTRKDILSAAGAPHGDEGPLYPGTCRNLREERDAPCAIRLDAAKAAAHVGPLTFEERGLTDRVDPFRLGDVVIARKELPAAYHLAAVVDDACQGVTLVTRGEDLLASTHVQRLLQALLGLPAPAYAHHRLIVDAQGRKFSKREASGTLRSLREEGLTASEIRAKIAL